MNLDHTIRNADKTLPSSGERTVRAADFERTLPTPISAEIALTMMHVSADGAPVDDSVGALAAEYLAVKAAADRADALKAALLARMGAEDVRAIEVAGLGTVTRTAVGTRSTIDGKGAAAVIERLSALLTAAGIPHAAEVPLTVSPVASTLRTTWAR